MCRMSFSVVVEDASKWPWEARQRAEAAGYDEHHLDWARRGLEEAMYEAGRRFIEQHPELFRGELI